VRERKESEGQVVTKLEEENKKPNMWCRHRVPGSMLRAEKCPLVKVGDRRVTLSIGAKGFRKPFWVQNED